MSKANFVTTLSSQPFTESISSDDLKTKRRIDSIDILRGIVMIIMALDHVRDYFHQSGDPLDLATTTPLLFFTRWITHFCAPAFVFLSGTSIYLQGLRKTKKVLQSFLIKRGMWLIFIEVFVISKPNNAQLNHEPLQLHYFPGNLGNWNQHGFAWIADKIALQFNTYFRISYCFWA